MGLAACLFVGFALRSLRHLRVFVVQIPHPSLVAWDRLSRRVDCASLRLTVHESCAQVQPVTQGIPWLGFVVYRTHRLLKRRNALNFRRRLGRNIDLYRTGRITFAELDASVQGWINHVRYADTWGLRRSVFGAQPILGGR